MSKLATEYAITKMNIFLDNDIEYNTLVLGSIHNLPIKYDRIMDWDTPDGDNVNFMFPEINSGKWNLIINCCCEHMYPMSEVTLAGVYVLQSNNFDLGRYINKCDNLQDHINQLGLDHIYFADRKIFRGYEYYTVIGEKD
jgi:hypothetical protein